MGNQKRGNPRGTIGLIKILEVDKVTEIEFTPDWDLNYFMICEG